MLHVFDYLTNELATYYSLHEEATTQRRRRRRHQPTRRRHQQQHLSADVKGGTRCVFIATGRNNNNKTNKSESYGK